MADKEYRKALAACFAARLGVDPDELYAASDAVWSNLNPQSVPYGIALSAAGAALSAALRVRKAADERRDMVWCENPAHTRAAHVLVMSGKYQDADSAASDPAECHSPHCADAPTGREPVVGHPYTVHD